jgi:RNAse (barnase) inhibitor barstar
MAKRVLEIDGNAFDTLEGFFDEVGRKLLADGDWGRNLDAFNDVLRGGFGTPDGGFVLRWVHSERSRAALRFPETIRYLEQKLHRCHPSNIDRVRVDLESARRGEGQTLFEIIVEIIQKHCPGGEEEEDGVELNLL